MIDSLNVTYFQHLLIKLCLDYLLKDFYWLLIQSNVWKWNYTQSFKRFARPITTIEGGAGMVWYGPWLPIGDWSVLRGLGFMCCKPFKCRVLTTHALKLHTLISCRVTYDNDKWSLCHLMLFLWLTVLYDAVNHVPPDSVTPRIFPICTC